MESPGTDDDLLACFDCLHDLGDPIGAQADEGLLGEVVTKGGFTRLRRATETSFNLVLEARP